MKILCYHEVQKLIRVRLAHQALQSNAPLEFLYAEDNAYPLVYKRTGATETIVVAVNPSDREVTCEIDAPGRRRGYLFLQRRGPAEERNAEGSRCKRKLL